MRMNRGSVSREKTPSATLSHQPERQRKRHPPALSSSNTANGARGSRRQYTTDRDEHKPLKMEHFKRAPCSN